MPHYIVKVMLQEVENEEIYHEFNLAMADEDGYPYITGSDKKIYVLPPDEFEFDVEVAVDTLLNIVKLVCSRIEKKHNLKPSPIVVVESKNIRFANLEQLNEDEFDS